MTRTRQISGMTCVACAVNVKGALDTTGARNPQPGAPADASGGDFDYDLAVIGSGGGAFSAAIAARRHDLSVVMIEAGTFGGTCVNVGCIPSKALLAAAEARHRGGHRRFPGISTEAGPVDFQALIDGKRELVEAMRRHKYIAVADDYDMDRVEGRARFSDGPALQADGRRITAAHYLVTTGAEPHIPDIPGLADSGYLTSTTAMELDQLPESMLVLGGGYVAMEIAQLFSRLGTEITMLVRSRLARREEPEVAAAIHDAFVAEGIRVIEGVSLSEVRRAEDEIVAAVAGTDFRAERLLVATGRRPCTDGLGLDAVGVDVNPGGEIVVDADMSTSNPRIWAAGDVTGHPQFVYVAAKQGALAVDNAFEQARRCIDYSALPRITFTNPTIAAAGLTEAEAHEQGIDCDCRVLGLDDIPRAIVSRNTRGVVKLVAERESGRVLGVHLVAEGAGDAILAGVYAIDARRTVADLANAWDPYLTIGEAVHLAAVSFTRDPSKLSCCAA